LKLEKVDPAEFFAPESGAVDATLAKVRDHVEGIAFDVTVPEGRAASISLAREVSSCKATIEKTGRAELKRLKASIKPIESQVKKWCDGMDGIRDDARRPVTKLEEAEAAKLAEAREKEAEAAVQRQADLERREKELAAKEAELAQQRLARERELQAEIDARAAGERAKKAADDAAKVKAQKVKIAADNKLKREREAKERAERDKAAAERRAKDAEVAAELRAEQAAAAEREKARQAELDRVAEEELKARAEELRQQDEKNQERVITEAVEDLNKALGSETIGSVIVALIERGQIRNVTLNF